MAAVKFSGTPSCMIFTLVARNRLVDSRSRRSMMSGTCSSPASRSHQSAPTTRAVSRPDSSAARYAVAGFPPSP